MKVAMITSGFFPAVDGVTISVWHRLQWLSQWGHEVLVLCPDYRCIASIYPNWEAFIGDILPGIRVVNLPSEPFMNVEVERNPTRSSYETVLQALDTFHPDLIHVDEPERLFLGFLTAPGARYAQQHHIPCIAFFHTNFVDYVEDYVSAPGWVVSVLKWISAQIICRVFNAYDLTLVSSEITLKKAHKMGIKNARKANILGVNLTQFDQGLKDPCFFQHQYKLSDVDDKIKLVFLGRLTPDKGWRFTLRAFSELADRDIPHREQIAVIIAGDGELREAIATHFHQIGIPAYLLGRVPPADVPALMMNSDIHITASEKETLGLTVLEAFAAGIPAIAPRAGGVVTTIQDGHNGFLYEPGYVEEFIQTLITLLASPELRQTLGQNGREDVAPYTWDRAVETLFNIWQETIQRHPTQRHPCED